MIDLTRYPRCDLGHFPTPLELMPNLSRHLGGPRIYIKRDDCTGLATGGNKTRKLEFLVAAALAEGADVLVTSGALQSNHVRQTIAASARMGIKCKVVVQQKVHIDTDDYNFSGNVMLDELIGGDVALRVAANGDMDTAVQSLVIALRSIGHKPFLIPGGGSTPLGVLGYIGCAQEMLSQSTEAGFKIDHLVHATGSGGTQAGLIVGMCDGGSSAPIHGISVGAPGPDQEERVWGVVQATQEYLKRPATTIDRKTILASSAYVGEGYGMPTLGMVEAVRLVARLEGILLDPVYSGKAMAGLIDLIRAGHFTSDENVVFIHSGGTVGLFAYRNIFNDGNVLNANQIQNF